MSESPTLETATTAAEALWAVARATWAKAHHSTACPTHRIPTVETMATWVWPANFRDALKEWMIDRVSSARMLLRATGVGFGRLGWPFAAVQTIDTSQLDELCLGTVYGPLMARPALHYAEKQGWDFLDAMSLGWVFGTVHAEWQELRGTHPLGVLVTAWQRETPVRVNADRSPGAILPTSLRAAQRSQARLPLGQDRTTPLGPVRKSEQGHLPDMGPAPSLVPPVPWLTLYDLTGTGPVQTRGRGAPLAQRLLVEVLTAVLRADRDPDWSTAPPITLRDLLEWCWPRYYDRAARRTRGGHDRSKHLEPLRRALIELDNMRIVCDRYERRLIRVDDLPTAATRLDDPIRFYVRHLPGSDRGPMLDRASARRWGVVNAAAWRMTIRLAYLWDEAKGRNNSARVYATRPVVARGAEGVILGANGEPLRNSRGAVVTNWSDRRAVMLGDDGKPAGDGNPPVYERNPAADRVPQLGPDDLIRLAFDGDLVRNRPKRLHLSREALRKKEAAGEVTIETDGDGWRILEPRPLKPIRGNAEPDTWQRFTLRHRCSVRNYVLCDAAPQISQTTQ